MRGRSWLAAAAALTLEAGGAAAESFTGVDATIRVLRDASFVTLAPGVGGDFDVRADDEITAIVVGDSGTTESQVPGQLTLEQVSGAGGAPRDLGSVDVDVGEMAVNASQVAGSATVGVTTDTTFTDPSAGELTLSGSTWDGAVSVLNGRADVLESALDSLSIQSLGTASVLGSSLGGLLVEAGGTIAVLNSTIGPSNTALNGDAVLAGVALGGATGTVRSGDVVLRTSGVVLDGVTAPLPGAWTVSGEFLVDGATAATGLDVEGDVQAGSTRVAGLQATAVSIHGADSQWTSAGGTRVSSPLAGAVGTLEVREGADWLEAQDFRLHHFLVSVHGAGSRLRVEGDLHVGQRLQANGTPVDGPGTLTVASGATVQVLGTLVVHDEGIVNLEPGGTIEAAAIDPSGTVNENGGALVVPEPGAAPGTLVAIAAAAARRRRV